MCLLPLLQRASAVSGLESLDRQIGGRLAANDEYRRRQEEERRHWLAEMEELLRRYDAIADRLARDVIRPHVAVVARHFDNAVAPECRAGRPGCELRLVRTPRFPSSAELRVGVTRDGEARSVVIEYTASIIPVSIDFEREDRLAMPLGEVDEGRVAGWVEAKLLGFVDAYLRVEVPRRSDETAGRLVTRPLGPALGREENR